MRRRLADVGVCLALLWGTTAWAWETVLAATTTLSGAATHVDVDGAGDVLAAGDTDGVLTVVKLQGGDGRELWRYQWPPDPSVRSAATALALRNGDPIVAGFTGPGTGVVVRLSSTTGQEVWRWTGLGAFSSPSLAVDPAGDVILGTWEDGEPLRVEKHSGSDGRELWRWSGSRAFSSAIVVDAAGDVVAAASPVVKLAGKTGDVVWQQPMLAGHVSDVLLDAASDDVVVASWFRAGSSKSFNRIVALAGATGRLRWKTVTSRREYPLIVTPGGDVIARLDRRDDSHPRLGRFRSTLIELRGRDGRRRPRWRFASRPGTEIVYAALDAAGDVIVSAVVPSGGAGQYPPQDSVVSKVRGRDGGLVWQQPFRGPGHPDGFVAYDIIAAPADDVVISGHSRFRFAVAKLSRSTGAE